MDQWEPEGRRFGALRIATAVQQPKIYGQEAGLHSLPRRELEQSPGGRGGGLVVGTTRRVRRGSG